MSQRISGISLEEGDTYVRSVFEAQTKLWGAPLINNRVYARRPMILRAVRNMFAAIDQSGLLSPALRALLNRRVAFLNHCAF
jgi:hypothetical protein